MRNELRELNRSLAEIVAGGAIPGLSFATLRGGEIEQVQAFGVRGPHDPAPVDAHTVFEAASLTKPLVSFIALQLAQEGMLDLAAPLVETGGDHVPADARARQVTALQVLSHTSGLPNIVQADVPLKTWFAPGERFSYGSSAFAWLQRAMEAVTGQPLETLARERVFAPFAMGDSSLHWQERFEANHAQGREMEGEPVPKRRPQSAQASWSLLTTAGDYVRFVQAVVRREGITPAMHARWFAPAVQVRDGAVDDLHGAHPPHQGLAWGLGWGLETAQQCFFHWGHNPGFRAFVLGQLDTRDAVVWFANSARGLRLAHVVLPALLPGDHPSVQWLQVGCL